MNERFLENHQNSLKHLIPGIREAGRKGGKDGKGGSGRGMVAYMFCYQLPLQVLVCSIDCSQMPERER